VYDKYELPGRLSANQGELHRISPGGDGHADESCEVTVRSRSVLKLFIYTYYNILEQKSATVV
jgi:hypothetical protein